MQSQEVLEAAWLVHQEMALKQPTIETNTLK